MILAVVVDVLLVLIALLATFYVARAMLVLVRLDKQARGMLAKMERTEATASQILDRMYRHQKQIDVLMADPKVQAVLNRHDRG